MKYISADQIAECREALRQGKKLDELAARLTLPADDLARLLDLRPSGSTRPDMPHTDPRPDIT